MPGVDIFVCTANPIIEPPIMVINTVLYVMAYDYPSEKLSVYLSDDGGSNLTFYALLEASYLPENVYHIVRNSRWSQGHQQHILAVLTNIILVRLMRSLKLLR